MFEYLLITVGISTMLIAAMAIIEHSCNKLQSKRAFEREEWYKDNMELSHNHPAKPPLMELSEREGGEKALAEPAEPLNFETYRPEMYGWMEQEKTNETINVNSINYLGFL